MRVQKRFVLLLAIVIAVIAIISMQYYWQYSRRSETSAKTSSASAAYKSGLLAVWTGRSIPIYGQHLECALEMDTYPYMTCLYDGAVIVYQFGNCGVQGIIFVDNPIIPLNASTSIIGLSINGEVVEYKNKTCNIVGAILNSDVKQILQKCDPKHISISDSAIKLYTHASPYNHIDYYNNCLSAVSSETLSPDLIRLAKDRQLYALVLYGRDAFFSVEPMQPWP